jgi:hypothetical protein
MELNKLLLGGLIAALTTLVMGKFGRSLLLLPFEWLVSKRKNKVDTELLKRAESDLGVTPILDIEKDKDNGK